MAEEHARAEETPVGKAIQALYKEYVKLAKKEEHIKALKVLIEDSKAAFKDEPEIKWDAGYGRARAMLFGFANLMLVKELDQMLYEMGVWLGVGLEVRAECPADLPEPPKELPKFEDTLLAQSAERLHRLGFAVVREEDEYDEHLRAYYVLCGYGQATIYLYAHQTAMLDC